MVGVRTGRQGERSAQLAADTTAARAARAVTTVGNHFPGLRLLRRRRRQRLVGLKVKGKRVHGSLLGGTRVYYRTLKTCATSTHRFEFDFPTLRCRHARAVGHVAHEPT